MKKLLGLILLTLAFTTSAHATQTKPSKKLDLTKLCYEKAQAAAAAYFETYVGESTEQLKQEAEEGGYEFDEADVPAGLELADSVEEKGVATFYYSWGERQECACGVEVLAKPTKSAKSCIAKVDKKSQGCECG